MKIGIITDVHNNLIALKTVVEKFISLKCDKIICSGDIIGIGPFPEETVKYLMQIPNLIAVCGNHEKYLTNGMPNKYRGNDTMTEEELQYHKWEHGLLSEESVNFLKSLPCRIDTCIEDRKITVIHYAMDQNGNYVNFKHDPSEEDLEFIFKEIDSDIIIYGHNHKRNICNGDKFYINVGSLGCPSSDKNIARAGLLNIENGNYDLHIVEIPYDVNSVIGIIDKLRFPACNTIKKYFYGL